MDFYYYNNNNEKVNLNINVGTKWDSLNIQNQQLNSIFSKVDFGDGVITNRIKLILLEKLLKKADGIVNSAFKNNVLENEELEELEKQINEGKISINEELFANDAKELEDISFTSENGTKFDIKAKQGSSSVINITTPTGKSFLLDCRGFLFGDYYYENQLPILKDVLNSIPIQVLDDMSNEISNIKLEEELPSYVVGRYNGNTIEYNTTYEKETMAFIHEVGHAIDHTQNGDMWSHNPDFLEKFDRLKELANKLIKHNKNHALDTADEYFASTYADMEFPNGSNNHIKELDELILPFKDSQNPEEKGLYELHILLKNNVKSRIAEVRKQPKNVRMDNNEET